MTARIAAVSSSRRRSDRINMYSRSLGNTYALAGVDDRTIATGRPRRC